MRAYGSPIRGGASGYYRASPSPSEEAERRHARARRANRNAIAEGERDVLHLSGMDEEIAAFACESMSMGGPCTCADQDEIDTIFARMSA